MKFESHQVSPRDGAPHARKRFIAGNGLNVSAANFIEATLCLAGPELPNDTVLGWIETFHQSVSQKSPCLARQGKRFCRDLFDSHTHVQRIPTGIENLKANLPASGMGTQAGWRNKRGQPSVFRVAVSAFLPGSAWLARLMPAHTAHRPCDPPSGSIGTALLRTRICTFFCASSRHRCGPPRFRTWEMIPQER